MHENFTLLLLSQHYPVSQQFHIFSYKDLSIDTDVADFLQASEQQVSQHVLDKVHQYLSHCEKKKFDSIAALSSLSEP
jgi:predicted HicB family RNase H-like nuclease